MFERLGLFNARQLGRPRCVNKVSQAAQGEGKKTEEINARSRKKSPAGWRRAISGRRSRSLLPFAAGKDHASSSILTTRSQDLARVPELSAQQLLAMPRRIRRRQRSDGAGILRKTL